MPTSFRPYDPEQQFLLPPSLRDWLPEGHLAYFIDDAIEALDLDAFYAAYQGDGRRNAPYEPRMMLKVLIYAYSVGEFSSRKIARRLCEDVAFRVLAANNTPSHRTICEFRQAHLVHFKALFVQVVRLAREVGLIKLGLLGLDGTKIKANASKHKAMSYGRMGEEQARLQAEIAQLIGRAQALDDQEDQRFGPGGCELDLPQEIQRREQRLERIGAAKQRLEARQRQQDEAAGIKDDEQNGGPKGPGRPRKRAPGEPPAKAQENFTDPDSRIMNSAHGFEQCYNAQAAVDAEHGLIVAAALTNNAADNAQLLPMLQAAERNADSKAQALVADAGYRSEESFVALEAQGVHACVALGREGKERSKPIDAERYPASARMAQRLASPEGRQLYRRRKCIPEPVFGWIKNVLGFRQFSVRGQSKVAGEWDLVCLALNLKRLGAMMQFELA